MGSPNHVIVLMFENGSFDHLLGYLPGIGDLTGEEFNLVDPANPVSEKVYVTNTGEPITLVGPGHSFEDTAEQLFGGLGETDPAPMNGFVSNYYKYTKSLDAAKIIMKCQSARSVPVLSKLAADYCVCTRWFASMPGPTWPNRFFAHSGGSGGLLIDDRPDPATATIQDKLSSQDRTWRVYAGDVPQCLAIESLLKRFVAEAVNPFGYHHFHPLARLFADLKEGSLPNYSFIEPHYFETSLWHATDQHPPHDLRHGEALLREVATSLAASDYWEDTLLVVLYDEHGGFYDKVSPPTGFPNPDGRAPATSTFDFTRLGPRVPAVLISPFIEPGTIDSTIYEHSSIPATLNKLFGLGPANFLGQRDAAAKTFEKNLTRATARPDRDLHLASTDEVPHLSTIASLEVGFSHAFGLVHGLLEAPAYELSDFQRGLLDLVKTSLPHLL